MAYRDNVTRLARDFHISNDPGLHEEDLWIASIDFVHEDGSETHIDATDMNRGGRLFIQACASWGWGELKFVGIPCDDWLRAKAAQYFAELWEDDPEPGKRPLLDAIRNSKSIRITYKWQ